VPLITNYGLLELFAVSTVSSIVPIPTEPTVAFLLAAHVNQLLVIVVLVTGSMIGASIGYVIGKYGVRRVLPFHNLERERRARAWFAKYGAFVLLISPWAPFFGDVIPIVAGIESYNVANFIAVMLIAKLIKGVAIVYFISIFLQLAPVHV
jgi:membrane protein YqaA with SNARE-associated domain